MCWLIENLIGTDRKKLNSLTPSDRCISVDYDWRGTATRSPPTGTLSKHVLIVASLVTMLTFAGKPAMTVTVLSNMTPAEAEAVASKAENVNACNVSFFCR